MTIAVQSLSELSATEVQQAFALATAIVQEQHANLDTKRGVISELVLGLDAILGAAHQTNADRIVDAGSIVQIVANPALADNELVDNVAANYGVTRRAASAAVGEVVIVLSQSLVTSIPAGAVFTYGDKAFTADATYVGRLVAGQVVATTDRLVTQISTSRWAFSIGVTASETGSASLLRTDNELEIAMEPTAFVRAYAGADFTGGLDAETNAEVMSRLAAGMSTTAYSNRSMIKAMIRNGDTDFANILEMSILGMGDAEMTRDQHWLFPVAGGGRSDIYLRSLRLPNLVRITKTATLIQKTGGFGIWQASIARADAPGFYEVQNIRLEGMEADGTNYAVQTDVRDEDLTGTNVYVPDIQSALEATFSRFQTAIITFLDTDTATAALTENVSTQDYDITVAAMPLTEDVQEFVGGRTVVNPAGDHLVKAAIPCFMSLAITLERSDSDQTVTESDVADAAADYVNTTGFPGAIYAADITAALASTLPASVSVSAMAMTGRVLLPDLTETALLDAEKLTFPTDYTNFASSRTGIFVLDPDDVTITVTDISLPGA